MPHFPSVVQPLSNAALPVRQTVPTSDVAAAQRKGRRTHRIPNCGLTSRLFTNVV